jgi:hypothetical protein
MTEERLTRIEDKLDKMSEAITTLARMEERMITLFKRMDKYDVEQSKLAERISSIEKVTIQRGVVYHFVDKGFWVALGGLVAWLVKSTGGIN